VSETLPNPVGATSPLIGIPDREQRERTLADYLPAHHRLRHRFGISADPDALTRFTAWYSPPDDARGAVLLDDALFLFDMIQCLRPQRMVELGTASGVSTAVLLKAMAAAHGREASAGDWSVQTYDLLSHCYWDSSIPVGYAVNIMAPELASRAVFHAPGVAADIARDFGPAAAGPLPLVFIDACHQHPYPVGDLLGLLPALAPGAWVILHDINLPARAAEYELRTGGKVHWGERGAKLLFDHWPYEKLTGCGGVPNIGAIRLPPRTPGAQIDPAQFAHIIAQEWETDPDDATRLRLAEAASRLGLSVRISRALRRGISRISTSW
jgi:predicted O-methyltransferase YrrM